MVFKLEDVVPWGRSGEEYQRMFNLTNIDLRKSILDCAGGPSSFNVDLTNAGYNVVSCDPIYQFSASEIEERIEATYPLIIEGLETNPERFVWQDFCSAEDLGKLRMSTMNKFLEDFNQGLKQGRYLVEKLPKLSFQDQQFELALCAHCLFTYSEQFSLDFHLNSIMEMCRVAREVRVFPLLENFTGETSPHLKPVQQELKNQGYKVEIETVDYEFQLHGNQQLKIIKA